MSPPLRTLRQTCGAPNLIVLLPGAYMTPEDFEKAGFFAAVSQRQLALDIAAVDLDFAAISGGTALPALQAEILEPARQQGYKKICRMAGVARPNERPGIPDVALAAKAAARFPGFCRLRH